LAALKRALTLGIQAQKILHRPYIPMLREDNTRQGFFEPAQVEAVKRHLPAALKPLLTFGAVTGWRLREVLRLTWAQVDFGAAHGSAEPRAGGSAPCRGDADGGASHRGDLPALRHRE